MGLCTAFVFAALVEFTVVNFWFRRQRSRNTGGVKIRYLEDGRLKTVILNHILGNHASIHLRTYVHTTKRSDLNITTALTSERNLIL